MTMKPALVLALAACSSSSQTATPAPMRSAAKSGDRRDRVGSTGRVEARPRHFHSDALGVDKDYVVYLPAGYGSGLRRATRWPVFYYLHGLGGDEHGWIKGGHLDRSRRSRTRPRGDRRHARRRRRLLRRLDTRDRLRQVPRGRHRAVHAEDATACTDVRASLGVRDVHRQGSDRRRRRALPHAGEAREPRDRRRLHGWARRARAVDAPSRICSRPLRATPASTHCSTRARIRTSQGSRS